MMDFLLATDQQIVGELGKRCRHHRLLANMTQDELARRAGVGVATLRRFESDSDYSPSLDTFVRIVRHLHGLNGLARVLEPPPIDPLDTSPWERQRARPREMPAGWTWKWGDED